MGIKHGTSHFVTREAAIRYFSAQCYTRLSIDEKFKTGEIKVGKPELKAGEKLFIIKSEGRYQIESEEK